MNKLLYVFFIFFCQYSFAGSLSVGGSNYGWYRIDGDTCVREPYGVIPNFHTQSAIIKSQLAQMRKNGQQRLRIPIFFGHGLNTGTVMDSTGGNLSAQNRKNLKDFLAAVKDAGFSEILVGFFPIGTYNDASSWTSYNEQKYQENWNLIYNLRPIIAAAGIHYRIDLGNEGIPASNQTALLEYAQHLWNDYVHIFGKNDTVGFSIISTTTQDRLAQLKKVYGNSKYGNHGAPYLFDIHIYGIEPSTNASAYSIFLNAYNKIHPDFPGQGWIIGEASYNDVAEAQNLNAAIAATGQTVFYITQWPLTTSTFIKQPNSHCRDVEVVPLDYNNYKNNGF